MARKENERENSPTNYLNDLPVNYIHKYIDNNNS